MCLSPHLQLGGWAVSGQWNRTDFNSTLRTLIKDYATFPFFSLQVGRDPKEITSGVPKKYIQASMQWDEPFLLGRPVFIDPRLLCANRLISLICWSQSSGTARRRSLKLKLRWTTLFRQCACCAWNNLHLCPASCQPDSSSFLGIMSEVPGAAGVSSQQQHDPLGHIHLAVFRAGRRRCTPPLPLIQRAALSAHDHQRAAGRGPSPVSLCAHHLSASAQKKSFDQNLNMPTAPRPCHWLAGLPAGSFSPTAPDWGWSCPAA